MSVVSNHLCRPCNTARAREWKEANPQTWERYARKHHLMKMYGITIDEYDQMRSAQNGRCAICGRPEADSRDFRLHVDHDHATGAVRGLLCGLCNQGIGSMRDDPSLLRIAVQYLEKHRQETE